MSVARKWAKQTLRNDDTNIPKTCIFISLIIVFRQQTIMMILMIGTVLPVMPTVMFFYARVVIEFTICLVLKS